MYEDTPITVETGSGATTEGDHSSELTPLVGDADSGGESSFLPSEAGSRHSEGDDETEDAATISSRLWREELPGRFRVHERQLLDLILEHHPETFTSQSILQVDSLTAFNLRALASHVHEFLATSPAKLTSSSILLFLDALRDLQQFYHFRLDWLDAGVRPFLSVPFRKIVRFHTSRQSRVEQRHAEATRIRN